MQALIVDRIVIGGDHAGFALKQEIVAHLTSIGVNVIDKGPYNDDSVDYPDFAHEVCKAILSEEVTMGILICGTGNGVAITANKYDHIRCGLVWSTDIASLIRKHNNANVLALPGRFISLEEALRCVDIYMTTEFEGGRHQRRVSKMIPPKDFGI
ncbi:MAG: ribose 5-phosphate isomerase B [Bacteroidota bacterium]